MTLLKKIMVRHDRVVIDEASKAEVFHVSDPHALVQAAGYLKHTLAASDSKSVFYRGQTRYYKTLQPSLLRDVVHQKAFNERTRAIGEFVARARDRSRRLGELSEEMVEPLLQHYGVRTTWIDLVDDVWVALWFACHRARTIGKAGEYLFFDKRLPRREDAGKSFAYIVLVATDAVDHSLVPGLWQGPTSELVDLRVGTPSYFVRPHAQHGVLFRLRRGREPHETDYRSAVTGVIRVDLADALDWLGEGRLLDIHALFPPPYYGLGYRILLEDLSDDSVAPDALLGGIHHVGA